MQQWSSDLEAALASGDPNFMKAALARVPRNVRHEAIPVLTATAQACAARGASQEALVYYDEVLALVPDSVASLLGRSQVYEALGRLNQALQDAQRSVELDPQRAAAHAQLGEVWARLGDLSGALIAYGHAQRLSPSDPNPQRRLAELQNLIEMQKSPERQLDQDGGAHQSGAAGQIPAATFDPMLFAGGEIPPRLDQELVTGLTAHVRRYSGLESSRRALSRLDDPVWLGAWHRALEVTKGGKVLLHGSELGVLGNPCLAG